ncbi:hypothetical protein Q3G72_015866 [Acer saccharum]|nr:hypothetical protein Q3G72_015866 [Acer saccharum]
MNAEEIIKLCDGLSIKEKEGHARTLDVGLKKRSENRLALSLVGKVLKKKLINREVFMSVMNKIWRVNGGVQIELVEGNIFVFYFSNLEDRQRILKGGPWSFDRATIIFDKPTEIGSFLGSMIGEVHDMDLGAMVEGSNRFLRVRVTMEVDGPLCDKLGHVMDECTVEIEEEREMSSAISKKLTVWLCASSPPKHSFRGARRHGGKELSDFLNAPAPDDGMVKQIDISKDFDHLIGPVVGHVVGPNERVEIKESNKVGVCKPGKWRRVVQPSRAGLGGEKFGELSRKRRNVEQWIEEGKRSRKDSVVANDEILASSDCILGDS